MKTTSKMVLVLLSLVLLVSGCGEALVPAPSATPVSPSPTSPGADVTALPNPSTAAPQAPWPTGGWQTSTPEEQGIDSETLVEMFEAIEAQGLDVHSVLVVRNGYLVLEAYFDPYGPDDVHTVESNTKSVVGALAGIAIEQGKIEDADAKLLDFFPGRFVRERDARKEAITLHHLLSMTSGLDCEDFSPAAQGMYAAPHWAGYLLDLPMVAEPGERWAYCSGSVHLLSTILQESTGMDARSYANQYLFAPLGIPEVAEPNWASDPDGVTNGIAGLYLAPRHLAKLGYLYLRQGEWDGTQIVPKAWMEAATREQAYIGPDEYVGGLDRRFGYLFSVFPDQHMYGYMGRAGQELFVIPDKDMLIVFTASLEVGKEASLLALVNDYLVPAAESEKALPANRAAQEQLQDSIREATGVARPVPALPQAALDVSGRTYTLDPNPFGWPDMALLFEPGSDQAVLRMSNTPDLIIGLDGLYRRTEMPGARPIGLRGAWSEDGRLLVDYVVVGDFSTSYVAFAFDGDAIEVTVENLNFPGQPVTVRGSHRP